MGFKIPKALQELPRWCVWRLKGKNKIPFISSTAIHNRRLKPANTMDIKQWGSYEQSYHAVENGNFNGMGFLLVESDGFIVIDIDNCVVGDGEELSPLAAKVLSLFTTDTYIEYSQSGQGLHIVCRGSIPNNAIAKDGEKKLFEVYAKNQYIAITGNAVNMAEPTDQQATINTLFKLYNLESVEKPKEHIDIPTTPTREGLKSDKEVIEQCKRGKNGEIFSLLWAGEKPVQYPTDSEADLDLMAKIWWRSLNTTQTIRLFRQSGRGVRAKAQRSDYLLNTLSKVIASREKWKQENYLSESDYDNIRKDLGSHKRKPKRNFGR